MKRLRDAGEARSREARGEPARLVPVVPDGLCRNRHVRRHPHESNRSRALPLDGDRAVYMQEGGARKLAVLAFTRLLTP